MTRSEFNEISNAVFDDLMPNVTKKARSEFNALLCSELQEYGVDIDDDFSEDDEEEE